MGNNNSKTLKDRLWLKIFLSVATFIISFIAISIIFNPDPSQYIKLRVANLFTKFAIIFIAIFFTKYIDKRNLSFLGLKFEKNRSIKLFFIGCLIGLLLLLFIDVLSYSFKLVDDGCCNFSWQMIYMGILIYLIHTLFTGLGEEMLFRGYILGNLLTKYNEFKAVILSSLVFTAIHVSSFYGIIDYLDIFLMGTILAQLFVITKSLYLPIGVHFIADFIQEEIFRNEAVNENPYALVNFKVTKNLIINGSNLCSKIEVLFVIAEIIILVFIYLYKKNLKTEI